MAIDFPASPTLNDVFTVGNVTYVWDGTKWTASVTGGISLDKIEEGNTSAEVIDTGSDGRFVVTTEGTERLRVTDTGLVGIGTNSPGSYNAYADDLVIANGSGNPGITLAGSATGWGSIYFADGTTGSEPYSGYIQYSHTNDRMTFATGGGLAAMHIDSSQRVGIGTASPAWPLDVNGIAKVKQAVLFEAVNSTNRWDLYTNTDDTFRFNYNGAGNDEITITSGGNVGIGAPPASWDPDAGLSAIQLNGYGAIWNYYNNVQLAFNTYQSSTGDKYLTAGKAAKYTLDSGGDHVWYTAGSGSANAAVTFSERARIDNSGRLLVGTSSASGSARAVFQGNNFSSGQPSIVYFQRDSSSSGLTAGAAITYLPFADNAGGIYGQIACLVDGVAGTNDYPGRLTFSTTPDGASSPTERMRITNSGYTIHHASGWVLEVATAAASGTTDRLIYGVSERAAAGAGGGNQVFIVYSTTPTAASPTSN
jgi:hypothetical protein